MSDLVKGWCPGAVRPMASGDGLIVRLRLSCSEASIDLARDIADWAQAFGNGLIDLSARGNLQLRGIREATLPDLTAALAERGLLDASPEAEAVRNVLVSPFAGLDPAAAFDVRPAARALERRLAGDSELWALPSKFGFSFDAGAFPLGDRADVRFVASAPGSFFVGLAGDDAVALGPFPADAVVGVACALAKSFMSMRRAGEPFRRMRDAVAALGVRPFAEATGLKQIKLDRERPRACADWIGAHGLGESGPLEFCGLPIPSPRLRGEGKGEGRFSLADGRPSGETPHPGLLPASGEKEAESAQVALDVSAFELCGRPIPSPRLRGEGKGEGRFSLADGRPSGETPHPGLLPASGEKEAESAQVALDVSAFELCGRPIPSPRLRGEGKGEGRFSLADGRPSGETPHPGLLPASGEKEAESAQVALDVSAFELCGRPIPSPRLRGEGKGEGRFSLADLRPGGETPHPGLLPASGEKEAESAQVALDVSAFELCGRPVPSPRLRGEGKGEGRFGLADGCPGGETPHPGLLPASGEKEAESAQVALDVSAFELCGRPIPSPRLRGEGKGEGRFSLADLRPSGETPHPGLLPASGEKEIAQVALDVSAFELCGRPVPSPRLRGEGKGEGCCSLADGRPSGETPHPGLLPASREKEAESAQVALDVSAFELCGLPITSPRLRGEGKGEGCFSLADLRPSGETPHPGLLPASGEKEAESAQAAPQVSSPQFCGLPIPSPRLRGEGKGEGRFSLADLRPSGETAHPGLLPASGEKEIAQVALDVSAFELCGRPIPSPRLRGEGKGEGCFSLADLRPSGETPHPGLLPASREKEAERSAFVGLALPFGRLSAAQLRGLCKLAAHAGAASLRLSPWRAVIVPVQTLSGARELADAARELDLIVDAEDPRLSVAACPGSPACLSAKGETREVARRLAGALPTRAGVGLHVSGCEKGCAFPGASPLTVVANPAGYDLIRNGRADDAPAERGLTLDALIARVALR